MSMREVAMDKIIEVLEEKYQVHELPSYHGEALYLIDFKENLEEFYNFQIYLTQLDNKIILTDLGSLEKTLFDILTDKKPNIINGIIRDTVRTFQLSQKDEMIYYYVYYFNKYANDVHARLGWLFMSLNFAVEIAKYYTEVQIDEYQGGRNG